MAEPTDINKNKSAVDTLMDTLRVELKELQKYKTADPEILGGKSGKPVPVPKKFTAEQTIAFMKMFPNAFPLADENAYFGIARALTTESPELFDVASFDAYEEKFGKTMEMQEKGASASKNITTAETPKAANVANDPKPKASKKINPETATVRQIAELYATEQKLDMTPKAYGNLAASFLPEGLADKPGSALSIFMPEDDGTTILSKTFKSLDLEDSNPKTSMQALRQVGNRIKQELPVDSNILAFLPDEKPDTPKNITVFGIKEPPKAVSEVAIKTDKATMQEFFRQVIEISKDPKQEAAAMAVLFNMQNGLRPNAAGMLQTNSYYADSRAIYIAAETKGAKGRKVNVPLNDIADSILQMRLQQGKTKDGYFFVKPNGKPVESGDMTKILKQVKIPDLIYDSGSKQFFDSLAPEGKKGEVPGKRGAPLLRNLHTKVAQRNGVAFERIAYLQGRSLKAAAQGSTGEVTTYAQDFPGDLDPRGPDVRNSNVVSSYFAEAAEEAGFNVSEELGVPTERVSRTTPGYEQYFETPVTKAPKVPAPVVEAAPEPTTLQELLDSDPEMKAEMEKSGFKFKSLIPPALLATATTVADTALKVTSAVAGPVLPVVGFQQTKKELEELGKSPEEAITQAALEELSTPMGVVGGITRPAVGAFVEAAKEPFQEETGMKLTDKNLERGILSKITGGQFKSSGGFIEKRE